MKIRWPRLTFPPINLWTAPHQPALEDTMTATAERDAVQDQLCARIDELERDKEVLATQVDRLEEKLAMLRSQADALHRIGYTLDLDPGTDLTQEAPARVEALVARENRWRAAYTKLTNAEQTQDADTHEYMHLVNRGLMAEFDAIVDEPLTTSLARHPDDAAVDRFAAAMKAKLADARAKGRDGWDNPDLCPTKFLATLLVGHIGKANAGNLEDIAALAMMLHQRGDDPAVVAQAHARLKAEWQAEAMEGWLEQMRYMEGLNTFDCMDSAEVYAEGLRRQAEGVE